LESITTQGLEGWGVVKISSCARLPSGGLTGQCGARRYTEKPVDGTDKLHQTFERVHDGAEAVGDNGLWGVQTGVSCKCARNDMKRDQTFKDQPRVVTLNSAADGPHYTLLFPYISITVLPL
jgi:hypothetical protein